MLIQGYEACNQEFLRAEEVSWNKGTSINIELQHQKEKQRREKISVFFYLETLKNFILNEKFCTQKTTIRAFFLQIRALFSNFRKRAGETSPPPHLQLRAWMYLILFFQKRIQNQFLRHVLRMILTKNIFDVTLYQLFLYILSKTMFIFELRC